MYRRRHEMIITQSGGGTQVRQYSQVYRGKPPTGQPLSKEKSNQPHLKTNIPYSNHSLTFRPRLENPATLADVERCITVDMRWSLPNLVEEPKSDNILMSIEANPSLANQGLKKRTGKGAVFWKPTRAVSVLSFLWHLCPKTHSRQGSIQGHYSQITRTASRHRQVRETILLARPDPLWWSPTTSSRSCPGTKPFHSWDPPNQQISP